MTPAWGLVVFDSLLTSDKITAQGVGTFSSSYGQSGGEPGVPVPVDTSSPWRPEIAGAQTEDLVITTVRGGNPGRKFSAARVLYTTADDTANTSNRGWSPPNVVTGWSSPPSTWGSGDFDYVMGCVEPLSGRLVVVGNTTTDNGQSWYFEPRGEVWTEGYDFGANQKLPGGFAALMPHPEVPGRVLLFGGAGSAGAAAQQVAYYSDDYGVTWDLYALAYASEGLAAYARSVAGHAGVPWLMYDGAYLLSSDDAGQNWTRSSGQLSTDIDQKSFTARVVARKGGGYLVAYVRATGGVPCVRLLPTALHDPADQTEIEVDAAVARDADWLAVTVDAAGVIWMITVADNDPGRVRVYGSVDEGLTWARFRWGPLASEDTGYIDAQQAELFAANGEIFIGCNAVGQTAGEVHLIRLGGWANVETGPGEVNDYVDVERFGFGYYDGSGSVERGGLYLPADYPENLGWTHVSGGGGGTRSFNTEPGLKIVCAAGADSDYYEFIQAAAHEHVAVELRMRVDAGAPNLGATAGTPATQAGIDIVLADGAYTYTTKIEIGLDGIRVVDGSTSRGSAAIDASSEVEIRAHCTNTGKATVWYRQLPGAGGTLTKFTRITNNATITDGGATVSGDRVRWGNMPAGTQATTSYWRVVGVAGGGAWHHGADGAADLDLTPVDGPRGLVFGHPATTRPGYPIPDATDASLDEQVGLLVCSGGPTYVSERVSAPVDWAHGVAKLQPVDSPRPSEYWESNTAGAQTVAYDLGTPEWPGGGVALVVVNARAPSVNLQIDDGAGGWATADTLDLKLPVTTVAGVAELYYTLTGRVAVPRTGTGTLSRYIHENELAGGWMLVSTSGGDQYREIESNSAGYWSTSSSVQRVRVTLVGVDGTEDASGTGDLYHHSGVLVAYPSTDTARRYRRLVFTSFGGLVDHNGDTVYHKAGVAGIGRVVGVGGFANWNWTRRTEFTRDVARGVDGVPVVTELGDARETWSYGWADGLEWQRWRTLEDAGDAVAASGGAPIGTFDDAVELIRMISTRLRSGEIPGCVIPVLPAATETILDPTRWVYGVPISDSVQISNIVGKEGTNEIVRLDVISWEQLK